jgi:hypothetical protein
MRSAPPVCLPLRGSFEPETEDRLDQKDEGSCILFPGAEPERKGAPESAMLLAFEDEGAEAGPNASANAAPITLRQAERYTRRRVLAEREGFEPSIRFPVYTLSKRAP